MGHVVVTGAAGGIGRAVAAAFTRAGHAVIATDRAPRPDALDCAHYVQADLAETVNDPASAEAVFDRIRATVGAQGLHALVNNAALQILGGVDTLTRDDWRATLDVNLLAPFGAMGKSGLLPGSGHFARGTPGQMEGFNYLGLGVLAGLLLVAGAACAGRAAPLRAAACRQWPLMVLLAAMAVSALPSPASWPRPLDVGLGLGDRLFSGCDARLDRGGVDRGQRLAGDRIDIDRLDSLERRSDLRLDRLRVLAGAANFGGMGVDLAHRAVDLDACLGQVAAHLFLVDLHIAHRLADFALDFRAVDMRPGQLRLRLGDGAPNLCLLLRSQILPLLGPAIDGDHLAVDAEIIVRTDDVLGRGGRSHWRDWCHRGRRLGGE